MVLTTPGKVVLLAQAQIGNPDGAYKREKYRNVSLVKWGWTLLKSEPACFIKTMSDWPGPARLLCDSDDFFLTTTNDVVADEIVSKLRTEWGVPSKIQSNITWALEFNGIPPEYAYPLKSASSYY